MTRRQVVLSAPAALLAQTAQNPPPLPQNAHEEIAAAREQQHRNAEQLDKVPLPMSTEPAVHFRV